MAIYTVTSPEDYADQRNHPEIGIIILIFPISLIFPLPTNIILNQNVKPDDTILVMHLSDRIL
jgi:hypothetical protein